jgi:expansin (peptidoglycan-binding protein)
MKLAKLFLIPILILTFGVNSALAQEAEQSQELEQKTKITCVTDSYGTSTSCTTEIEQNANQSQRIAYLDDGTVVVTHRVLDTGLTKEVNIAILSILALGTFASFVKINKA